MPWRRSIASKSRTSLDSRMRRAKSSNSDGLQKSSRRSAWRSRSCSAEAPNIASHSGFTSMSTWSRSRYSAMASGAVLNSRSKRSWLARSERAASVSRDLSCTFTSSHALSPISLRLADSTTGMMRPSAQRMSAA